ncbi:MAG: hypothetical protein LBD13_04140 [Spirochaetaceae bacterium]|jgi:hypothetical protein|nr:hypothetical protein [Spirochaetaceae bacterium]
MNKRVGASGTAGLFFKKYLGPLCTAITAAWLVFAVVFAGAFVVAAHDHDHTGAECRICLEIQIALRILETSGAAAALPARFVKRAASEVKPRRFLFVKKSGALKVRLNC